MRILESDKYKHLDPLCVSRNYAEFMILKDLIDIKEIDIDGFCYILSNSIGNMHVVRALKDLIEKTDMFDRILFKSYFNINFYLQGEDALEPHKNIEEYIHFDLIEKLVNHTAIDPYTINRDIAVNFSSKDIYSQDELAECVLEKMSKKLDIDSIKSLYNIRRKLESLKELRRENDL